LRKTAERLRTHLLNLNNQLVNIDEDIAFLGGVTYDELSWSGNPVVSNIANAWNRLKEGNIIPLQAVTTRISQDTARVVFFYDLRDFCKALKVAKDYVVNENAKEEQDARMQAKKHQYEVATKKALQEMVKIQVQKEALGTKNILEAVNSAMEEEQQIEQSKEMFVQGQQLWQKALLKTRALLKFRTLGLSESEGNKVQKESNDEGNKVQKNF